ncbi:hypothetical protein [Thermococcus eurythermalis]|nr:hypothetical protein [Thermococcus eurythermalis]
MEKSIGGSTMEYLPPVGGDIGVPADTFVGVNDVFGVNYGLY